MPAVRLLTNVYGRVVSVRADRCEGEFCQPSYVAKLKILRVYDGKAGPALLVTSIDDEGTCGVRKPRIGDRLALLLHGRARSPRSISLQNVYPLRDFDRATAGRWHRPGPA